MKLKSTSIIRAAFAALLIATGTPAGAQTVLSPPTPPVGQTPKFGTTVVTGERFILIADTGDDQRGNNAGAVYIRNIATNALTKLTADDGAAGDNFGSSVALSYDVALIGANLDDDLGTDSGSAYVFNLNTGRLTTKLNAQDAAAGDKFGSEVALQGDAAWVSATGKANTTGVVYSFRLSTRQQNLRLTANDGAAGDFFGSGLALSGSFVLVGASGDDDSAGSCYLFDADRGIPLRKITARDRAAGDAFGGEVSMSGDIALIGAAGDDDLGNRSGAAYLVRVSSGTELHKLRASDGSSTDLFGSSVSLNVNLAVVGAPFQANRGQAYVFDASTGVELRKLAPAGLEIFDKFGSSVSVYASRIVVGMPQNTGKNGQALIFNDQSVPAPVTVIATRNAAAPNVANATFNVFTAHTINNQGESMLAATLNNAGANNTGLWNRLNPALDLMVQKGQAVGGPVVAAIQTQVLNNRDIAVAKVQLTGAGVNGANDIQLITDNGITTTFLLRESQALNGGGFTGQVIRDIKEVTASYDKPQAAFFASFVVTPAVPATADSGIVILDLNTNAVLGGVREGDLSPFPRVTIGAIAERTAFTGNTVIASVALTGAAPDVTVANNAALLQIRPGQAVTAIVRKGEAAPGTTETFTAFTAETVSTIDEPVFLASLSGAAATNQGIWTRVVQAPALSLVLRKDAAIFAQDGSSIGKVVSFTRFWSLGFGKVLVQAKLALTAPVTTANDDVILLCRGSSTILLFREGDTAANCDGARITAIQKVDADPNSGDYAILTTLSSGAATNQALWIGDANGTLLVNENALLRPVLTLRKDSLHTISGISARLTSMDMTLPADTTFASGRGLGSPVASRKAATVLSYGVNNFAAISNRQ